MRIQSIRFSFFFPRNIPESELDSSFLAAAAAAAAAGLAGGVLAGAALTKNASELQRRPQHTVQYRRAAQSERLYCNKVPTRSRCRLLLFLLLLIITAVVTAVGGLLLCWGLSASCWGGLSLLGRRGRYGTVLP